MEYKISTFLRLISHTCLLFVCVYHPMYYLFFILLSVLCLHSIGQKICVPLNLIRWRLSFLRGSCQHLKVGQSNWWTLLPRQPWNRTCLVWGELNIFLRIVKKNPGYITLKYWCAPRDCNSVRLLPEREPIYKNDCHKNNWATEAACPSCRKFV